MVRYYGIYARPVRKKIRLVADACGFWCAAPDRWRSTLPQRPGQPDSRKLEERFAKGEIRCPACGSANMLLIRIWTKTKGVVYREWGRTCLRAPRGDVLSGGFSVAGYRQLTLAI